MPPFPAQQPDYYHIEHGPAVQYWTASPSHPPAQLDQKGVEILVDEHTQEGFAVGAAARTGTGRMLHLFG